MSYPRRPESDPRNARNGGYASGQIRMWRSGLLELGPVRLDTVDHTHPLGRFGNIQMNDVWWVQCLITGHTAHVSTQDLGRVMAEMEVVAWSSR